MRSEVLFTLLFLLLSNACYGQVSSGSGIDPAGNPANLPATDSRSANYNPNVPGTPLGSSGQPRETWAEQWGAIARDETGHFGIVTDLSSKPEATKVAIEECRNRGGQGCSVNRVFVNQCAAVVLNADWTQSANAPTVEEAVEMGKKGCEASNTGSCRVYWSGCSLPKRIQ